MTRCWSITTRTSARPRPAGRSLRTAPKWSSNTWSGPRSAASTSSDSASTSTTSARPRRSGKWPSSDERCRYDLDEYCDLIVEAKRRGLPVKLGLEVDWLPDRADELAEILAPYPWDYLLGSVHWIGGLAVDSQPGLWEQHAPAEVWALYARELAAAARSGHFDVLAHPDLVKIFGDRVDWDWQPVIDALDGVALEVSTAGLHKPVGELYPEAALLRGARRVTLASDAHLAENVGRDFVAAVEHARAAGFETVTVFDGRSSRQEPLG